MNKVREYVSTLDAVPSKDQAVNCAMNEKKKKKKKWNKTEADRREESKQARLQNRALALGLLDGLGPGVQNSAAGARVSFVPWRV